MDEGVDEKFCEERHKALNARIDMMEKALENFAEKLDAARWWVVKIVVGVLVAAFVLFGGSTVGMVIYIATKFPQLPTP